METLRERLNRNTDVSDIMRNHFHLNTDDFQISEPQMMFNSRRMLARKRGFDVRAVYGAGRRWSSVPFHSHASTLVSLANLNFCVCVSTFLRFFFFFSNA